MSPSGGTRPHLRPESNAHSGKARVPPKCRCTGCCCRCCYIILDPDLQWRHLPGGSLGRCRLLPPIAFCGEPTRRPPWTWISFAKCVCDLYLAWIQSCPYVLAWIQSSPYVLAWIQSSSYVLAWIQSCPYVLAWIQSSPYVLAWIQSCPYVLAWMQSSSYVPGKLCPFPRPPLSARSAAHLRPGCRSIRGGAGT